MLRLWEVISGVWSTWWCRMSHLGLPDLQQKIPFNRYAPGMSGWWFGTWLLFSISYMGCHPSHWLIFFKMVKTTNQIYIYIHMYTYIYRYMYIYNTFKMVKTTSQKCMCLPFHWALEFPAEFHGGVHGSQAATGWSGWPPPYFAPGVPCALRRTARGKCSARWNIRCHGRKLWRGWGRNQRMDMIWYDIFIYIYSIYIYMIWYDMIWCIYSICFMYFW